MTKLIFLGSGGGRFVTQTQTRRTGGLWLEANGKNIMIDPAPGTIVRSLEYNTPLLKLDAILVSHKHLDHYGDTEVCIEGMTHGMGEVRGTLFINKNTSSYVSDYHKDMTEVIEFSDIGKWKLCGIDIETIPTFNHDGAFGFKFHLDDCIISVSSDTNYSPELAKYYSGSDILILNVLRPDSSKIQKHLCVSEAAKIISEAKPKLAIITHFGYELASSDTDAIAEKMTKETGVDVISAHDGLGIDV